MRQLFALFVFPGFAFLLVCAWFFDWLDRRVLARLQGRVGPPWYQPVADFLKLMAKEDMLPEGADARIAAFLPILSLAAVLTAGFYVPVAGRGGCQFEGDLIVILFLLSIPALAYFLAGWVSIGVYSILGGNRSLLQYFSYEVPFLMALSGPAILADSWCLGEIAARQAVAGWGLLQQPLGFLLALVGLIGKLKRDPLDIPKAKSEVVAGPLTEFSGRKLALWHLAMDMQTVVGIFLIINTFVGGASAWGVVPTSLIFAGKAILMMVLLSIVSALYARLRIDQLATLGWRVLAPLALVQLLVTIWIGG
jgi:NADH-quinone oxidoreductase subunit H